MTPATEIWMSKNLLRMGIDPASADFVWEWEGDGIDAIYLKYHYNKHNGRKRLPAWSLQSLLALMPTEIIVNDKEYFHVMRKWHDPDLNEDRYELGYENYDNLFPQGSIQDHHDPLHAAYDMICWLVENNLLK